MARANQKHLVTHPDNDALACVKKSVPKADCSNIHALIIEELRRLYEGVLSRYGLRASEFENWKKRQKTEITIVR